MCTNVRTTVRTHVPTGLRRHVHTHVYTYTHPSIHICIHRYEPTSIVRPIHVIDPFQPVRRHRSPCSFLVVSFSPSPPMTPHDRYERRMGSTRRHPKAPLDELARRTQGRAVYRRDTPSMDHLSVVVCTDRARYAARKQEIGSRRRIVSRSRRRAHRGIGKRPTPAAAAPFAAAASAAATKAAVKASAPAASATLTTTSAAVNRRYRRGERTPAERQRRRMEAPDTFDLLAVLQRASGEWVTRPYATPLVETLHTGRNTRTWPAHYGNDTRTQRRHPRVHRLRRLRTTPRRGARAGRSMATAGAASAAATVTVAPTADATAIPTSPIPTPSA